MSARLPYNHPHRAGPPAEGFYSRSALMTVAAPNMKYLFAGSVSDMTAVDRITYHAAPEPSTLLLTGLGLAGLVRVRYRRYRD